MAAKKQNPEEILEITKSEGNVFADLNIPNAAEHLAKIELVHQINKIIAGKKQKEAADLLGIDQPKISALKKGNVSGFSIDRLLGFLNKLNQDVEIIIKPHNQTKTMPHITVSMVAGNLHTTNYF